MVRDEAQIEPAAGECWLHQDNDTSAPGMPGCEHRQVCCMARADNEQGVRQAGAGRETASQQMSEAAGPMRRGDLEDLAGDAARQGGQQTTALDIVSGLTVGKAPDDHGAPGYRHRQGRGP